MLWRTVVMDVELRLANIRWRNAVAAADVGGPEPGPMVDLLMAGQHLSDVVNEYLNEED